MRAKEGVKITGILAAWVVAIRNAAFGRAVKVNSGVPHCKIKPAAGSDRPSNPPDRSELDSNIIIAISASGFRLCRQNRYFLPIEIPQLFFVISVC